MYHPIKRFESAWNASTPEYLHPRTKENMIWQLKLTALLLAGMWAKDWWDMRQEAKKRKEWTTPDPV